MIDVELETLLLSLISLVPLTSFHRVLSKLVYYYVKHTSMFAEHTLVQLGGYNTNIIQFESRLQVFSEIHSPSAAFLLLKFSFLIHRRKVQG